MRKEEILPALNIPYFSFKSNRGIEVQRLTMTEFKKICSKICALVFVYDTDNQKETYRNLKIVNKFTEVIIMLNPNRICFRNPGGTMCINNVLYVDRHDPKSVGEVFDIVCSDAVYTIIADRKKFS